MTRDQVRAVLDPHHPLDGTLRDVPHLACKGDEGKQQRLDHRKFAKRHTDQAKYQGADPTCNRAGPSFLRANARPEFLAPNQTPGEISGDVRDDDDQDEPDQESPPDPWTESQGLPA